MCAYVYECASLSVRACAYNYIVREYACRCLHTCDFVVVAFDNDNYDISH